MATEDSYPLAPVGSTLTRPVTILDHQAMAGLWAPSGVVEPTGLVLSTSTTQSQVTVSPGSALIQGERYVASGQVAVAVGVNASGLTRIDRVVLRLTKATGVAAMTVIPGTPGGGEPGLVNNVTFYDLPIGKYTVQPGQLPTSPVDERRWVGGETTASSSANPPLNTRAGHHWFQSDTGFTLDWNGSAWTGAGYATCGFHGTSWTRTGYAEYVQLINYYPSPAATYPPTLAADANSMTIPTGQGGLWDMTCKARFDFSSAGGQATLIVLVNGSIVSVGYTPTMGGSGSANADASMPLALNDGDVVVVEAQINTLGITLAQGVPFSQFVLARRLQ